ncbi:Lysocardiolipin acyltransferase 1 [Schistosoma japonicum]|nr:Lysocardiolipin acyltransferase 1 [Schistosoma japonicum]
MAFEKHINKDGFRVCFYLSTDDHLTEVYDVTVAYPDILPSPEINLIYGQVPHEVHYLVRRFTLNDLLNNGGNNSNNQKLDNEINDTLSKWLQNRWLEKEKSLKEYYANPIGKRSFDNEITPDSLVFHVNSSDQLVFTYLGLFNTGIWFLSMLCLLYLIYTTFYIRIYFVTIQMLFCYFTYFYNGINMWATQWINKNENNERIDDPTINSAVNNSNLNANNANKQNDDASNVFIHSVKFQGIDVNKKAT